MDTYGKTAITATTAIITPGRPATTSSRLIGVNAGLLTTGNITTANTSWSKVTGARLQAANKERGASPAFLVTVFGLPRLASGMGLLLSATQPNELSIDLEP